jgi:hypothetical protein
VIFLKRYFDSVRKTLRAANRHLLRKSVQQPSRISYVFILKWLIVL